MSKRQYSQQKRRQVRRALNSAPEAFKALGLSRAMRLGWGSGMTAHDLKERSRPAESDKD